jgi:hypothetical protein
MSRQIRQQPRMHDREVAMAWLHDQFAWPGFVGPDFHNQTPGGRHALIEWLHRKCVAMRAAGIRGAHQYSLPLHIELLRILRAERAALQAIETAPIIVAKSDTESLPAIPDRQRLRAA